MAELKILEDHVANLSRCVEFIEQHLEKQFTVEDLAKEARMSFWHFQKIFHILIGESIKSYVRRRRLTIASQRLVQSKTKLESIAHTAGFQSLEAFSRAFKQQFDVTPGAFRKEGRYSDAPATRARIDREYISSRLTQVSPPVIEIVELPPRDLIGIRGEIHTCLSEAADGPLVTPSIWKKLQRLLHPLRLEDLGEAWALIEKAGEELCDSDLFSYTASITVDAGLGQKLQKQSGEFTRRTFPGGLYAVFKQSNPPVGIRSNLNYLFCIWLYKNTYTLDDRAEFEMYPPDYLPQDPDGSFTYGIPIRKS
jgi:AraC family transcriptional regulator